MSFTCVLDALEETKGLGAFARGPLISETILWGLFSCLMAFSCFLWTRDSPHSRARKVMIAICMFMYAMATVHWGLTFGWWRKASRRNEDSYLGSIRSISAGDSNYTAVCAERDDEDLVVATFGDSYYLTFSSPPTCAPGSILMINVILSDAIVLFRACTIWGRKRTTTGVSITLFALLLIAAGVNIWSSCGFSSICTFCGPVGLPAACMSFMLNVWATAIIAYKAWAHKRVIKSYLTTGSTRTRAEKLLGLFVDSGALYSALWVTFPPHIPLFIE
ncbi:hypothetical protein BC629DRAFT_1598244 [Irpex lacteus]|nr:hypothetical protein BC629DRAFT_1598244 [Irpex lacteus]